VISSPTVIPAHTRIEGHVETPSDLEVEGVCLGELHVGGTLTVAADATCRAQIRARVCVIYGEVIGNIVCSESITLGEGARVVGDVRAPEISIDPASEVDGRIDFLAPEPSRPSRSSVRVAITGGHLRRPAPPSRGEQPTRSSDGD
jgi:cytoskeletal protein CcmA (bactofilin family)